MSKKPTRKVEDKMRPSRCNPEWDSRTRHYLGNHQRRSWKKRDGVNLILAKYAKEMDGKLVRSPVELSHAAERIRQEINKNLPPKQRHKKHKPLLEILMRGARNPELGGSSNSKTRRKIKTVKGRVGSPKSKNRLEPIADSSSNALVEYKPPKNVKERFGKETTIGRILSLAPNSPFPLEDLLERSLKAGVSVSSAQAKKMKKSKTRAAAISPSEKFAQHSLEEAIAAAKKAAMNQKSMAESIGQISFFVGDHLNQSFDISKYLLQALGDNFVAKDNATLGTPMLSIPFQTNAKATEKHIQRALTEIPLVEHVLDSDAIDSTPTYELLHPSLKFKAVKVTPLQYHPRSKAADISKGERPDPFKGTKSVAFLSNYKAVTGHHDELQPESNIAELVDDRAATVSLDKKGLKITTDWNTRVGEDPGDKKTALEALNLDSKTRPSVSYKMNPKTKEPEEVTDKPSLGIGDINSDDEHSD